MHVGLMLNLHDVYRGIFPTHVINHILSYRQPHPAAELIKQHHARIRERVEKYATLTHDKTFMELSTYDCHFRNTLFGICLYYYLEGTNYYNLMQYNSRVIGDYDGIYTFYGGADCSIINMDVYVITDIWRW